MIKREDLFPKETVKAVFNIVIIQTKPLRPTVKNYIYDKGRLKRTNSNAGTKYFLHDNLGNCTHFCRETEASEANLFWERGSLLKSMILQKAKPRDISTTAEGVRYKRRSAEQRLRLITIRISWWHWGNYREKAGFYHDGGLVGLFVRGRVGGT